MCPSFEYLLATDIEDNEQWISSSGVATARLTSEYYQSTVAR